jgi:hypothetical protein
MLNISTINKRLGAIGSAVQATRSLRLPRWPLYLLALEAFILAEQQYGGIRFTNTALNDALVPVFFAIPVIVVVLLLCGKEPLSKACGIVLAVVFSGLFWLAFPIVFAFGGSELLRCSDGRIYDNKRYINMPHSTVVVYSDSPGAFGSYGAHIDEERILIPGVKWVRYLATANGLDATVTILDPHHIRCSFDNDVASQPDKVFYIE